MKLIWFDKMICFQNKISNGKVCHLNPLFLLCWSKAPKRNIDYVNYKHASLEANYHFAYEI